MPRGALAWLAGAALAAAAPAPLAAQDLQCDPGDVEVRSLSFVGNRRFSDGALARFIVTTPSSWARRTLRVVGAERCLDQEQLPLDTYRLSLLYRKHGYYRARVDLTTRPRGQSGVDVTFHIDEGAPLRVDSLTVRWATPHPDSARFARDIRPRVGEPFDQFALDSSRAVIIQRLRDAGYPRADVLRSTATDTAHLSALVELTVVPGAVARVAGVRIVGDSTTEGGPRAIPADVLRRMIGLRTGSVYRERDLISAQRNLYQTDAFRHAEVRLAPDSVQPPGDTAVVVDVVAIEGRMRAVRAGVGYGTLDCFRAQGELTNRNFLRGAQRLELTARVSKIGVAGGGIFRDNLCSQAWEDSTFSRRLNHYAAATYRRPTLFGLGPQNIPTLTIFSERRSEYKAYLRTTPIGGVATLSRANTRVPLSYSYELSLGRTEAQQELFCAVFNYCAPEDYRQLNDATLRLAALTLAASRDRTDDVFNPTRGDRVSLELRHASPAIGGDELSQFNKVFGEASHLLPLGRSVVLATRVRGGAVFGRRISLSERTSSFIPPQERFYAGGANTVRGYQQNELGPLVYVTGNRGDVRDTTVNGEPGFVIDSTKRPRAVPVGGNTLFVANAELRLPDAFFPSLLQWSLFADAGAVWDRGIDVAKFGERLRVTPGIGVRVLSFLGPIRLDVGYNGYDATRGPVYYSGDPVPAGELVCAETGTVGGPKNDAGCATDFAPRRSERFLSRLTFNFSLGQAF
ncbi:MAG TPA: BamA/TamA family outer membrane protein [Gemmatimonadaceae bacterium]|nr:BamA/TamA family outer membrane protein [Gemmatimonadaceae bacterium]